MTEEERGIKHLRLAEEEQRRSQKKTRWSYELESQIDVDSDRKLQTTSETKARIVNIGREDIPELTKQLCSDSILLTHLSLRGSSVCEKGAYGIALFLGKNTTLTTRRSFRPW